MTIKKSLTSIISQNKLTLLSLLIILSMFGIFKVYYTPTGLPHVAKGTVTGTGEVAIGGDFSLTDHHGQPFTQDNLKDSYTMMFFGFTSCPDVCPTSLSKMADVYDKLPTSVQNNLQVVFVAVDPDRDRDVIADYVPAFHEDFLGVTGEEDELKQMAKDYWVYFAKKEPDESGFYLVDHSSFVYFMGPDGKYIRHFGHSDKVDDMVSVVNGYMAK